ncbi:MAG: competence protein CoiA family protein [Burkholderiaceae bacterium]
MITEIIVNGDLLHIEDASGIVMDDFGNRWVSVQGEIKSWHFRVPPNMREKIDEYNKEVERLKEEKKMSEWHINTQNMLQKIFPKGQQEFTLGNRRADFVVENRVFEVQYSDMPDDELYNRTKDWREQKYYVTWILAPHILNQAKYEPARIWHGGGRENTRADFPVAHLWKWLKPLEFSYTDIITTLPLFEWGGNISIKWMEGFSDWFTGEPCIYRFYGKRYDSKYGNYIIQGGCAWNIEDALTKQLPGEEMYNYGYNYELTNRT